MTNSSSLLGCGSPSGAQILASVLYSFFSVSGTAANLLVIYLVCSFRKLKTTSNAFIVNGCVSGLLVCAFWMPQETIGISGSLPRPPVYRAFMEGLLFLWMTVSLLSHSLVALNRYVLITKAPAVYRSVYQRRHAECMIATSWLLPLLLLLPWLLGQGPATCANVRLFSAPAWQEEAQPAGSYTATLSAVTILSQTLVLLYCYSGIFRKVQVSMKRVSVLNFQVINHLPGAFPRKERRLGFHALFVCCAFVLSTAPFMWVTFCALLRPVAGGPRAASWLLFCLLFVLDPLIYTCKNEEFRRSFRCLLRGELCGKPSAVGVDPAVRTVSQLGP
ncbi:probable G-protein coupled receptor 88 [Rhinatrema bivittatum]|uniref:probable G-protein coupled receptor 88 n=1 Tax=Rhinatrema bivittatum TaxID=194408 RepID=UPI00112EE41B|nr:probable G-protein coupled receptor 88 [Rhinatrema bivittatum]